MTIGEDFVSLLGRLQQAVERQHRIVISAVAYSEMRFGEIGKKPSPKQPVLVRGFWVESMIFTLGTRVPSMLLPRLSAIYPTWVHRLAATTQPLLVTPSQEVLYL